MRFDKSIHPVVLYKYYLICIFMKIHENLKNEEKTQNHKPGEGGEVVGNYIYLALLVHLTMYAKSFSGTPCVRIKAVVFFFK